MLLKNKCFFFYLHDQIVYIVKCFENTKVFFKATYMSVNWLSFRKCVVVSDKQSLGIVSEMVQEVFFKDVEESFYYYNEGRGLLRGQGMKSHQVRIPGRGHTESKLSLLPWEGRENKTDNEFRDRRLRICTNYSHIRRTGQMW